MADPLQHLEYRFPFSAHALDKIILRAQRRSFQDKRSEFFGKRRILLPAVNPVGHFRFVPDFARWRCNPLRFSCC